jgi:hypothetical protein
LRRSYGINVKGLRSFIMSDLILISGVWLLVGAAWTYYIDKRSYNDGMVDAIVMHNRGQLTYKTYDNEDGEAIIELEVRPSED